MNDVDMYYVYLVYRISCTICYSLYYFIYGLIFFKGFYLCILLGIIRIVYVIIVTYS